MGEIISELILDLSIAEKYSLLAKFNKNSDESNSSDKNLVIYPFRACKVESNPMVLKLRTDQI